MSRRRWPVWPTAGAREEDVQPHGAERGRVVEEHRPCEEAQDHVDHGCQHRNLLAADRE
jgi:hypothetical protein